ncbi:MAG: glycogen synthase, partial [Spirochaetales bacterium]|nr:glycogen synthase [Spirochaetales bacterium]
VLILGEAIMRILMISSEAIPFAKTGGLADVVTALSNNLKKNGHDVKIFLPYYSNTKNFLKKHKESEIFEINSGVANYSCTFVEDSATGHVFLKNDLLFNRSGVYGINNTPFADNDIRFSVFAKAALEYCKLTSWQPEIVHCHDWPAGLAPAYIKEENDFFKETKSCFTIHNLGYQGIFSRHSIHYTNLPIKSFTTSKYLKGHKINYLKSALINSDYITTVSEGYARETQTPEFGFGLDKILRDRKSVYSGILNGIDYSEWNSKKDKYLYANYDSKDLSGKQQHKEEFCKNHGLDPELPLITLISRLSEQKGINELYGNTGIMDEILSTVNANIVVVGTGELWAEEKLKQLEQNYPNFKAFLEFKEDIAHIVEAAGDFFLMPSKYEPCGLNQMYSLHYGNIPIVSNTGGLSDTVKSRNDDPKEFTGFVFNKIDAENIIFSISEAIKVWYNDKELLNRYIKNGMKQDLSWKESCKKYEKLYTKILNKL